MPTGQPLQTDDLLNIMLDTKQNLKYLKWAYDLNIRSSNIHPFNTD